MYGIALMLLGVLAAVAVFTPYGKNRRFVAIQIYLWILFTVIGAWGLIRSFTDMDLTAGTIALWVTRLVVSIDLVTLGIMMIRKVYTERKTQGEEEGGSMTKFSTTNIPFIGTMCIIAFGLGLWQIVAAILW